MSVTLESNLSDTYLFDEGNFPSLTTWIESIGVSYAPKNYLALAVVIQQEIEPIMRKKEPEITMRGNVLTSEITQSKAFSRELKILSSKLLDPAFPPILNSQNTPLSESIIVTRVEETVNKISKVILLVARIDHDKSALELFCQGSIYELNRVRNSIKGPFKVSAQTLSSESPCFSHLTNSAEPHLLTILQDSTNQSLEKSEKPVFTLEPKEGVLLEKHFEHGESETTNTELLFALKGDELITTQEKSKAKAEFTDLIYESEESFNL
jgi:hypothetical protein